MALRTVLVFIVLALISLWVVVWNRADRTQSRVDLPPRRQWEAYAAAALFGVLVVAGDAVEVNGRDMAGRPVYWVPAAVLLAGPVPQLRLVGPAWRQVIIPDPTSTTC